MDGLTKSVLRKLWKMKWRSMVFALVVAFAMAMLVTGLYTASVFDHSIDVFIQGSNFPDMFIELSDRADEGPLEANLSSDESVAEYSLRLKAQGTYHNGPDTYPAIFIGVREPARVDISKLDLVDGEFFEGPGTGVVVSGMEAIGAKKGEALSFTIGSTMFNISVTGSVTTPEYLFFQAMPDSSLPLPGEMVVIYMDLDHLQDLAGEGVNDIILITSDGHSDEEVISSLQGLPISKVTYQMDHPSVKFMELGSAKMKNMFPLISSIFMVVGIISIFMTFYRVVMNDSRYIGVMMSLGYSRGRITASYLSMGVFLASVGSIFGIVIGLLFTYGIMSFTMTMIGDISISLPMDPFPFLIGMLYSFGCVIVSVGIPVLLVTRQSVRENLDYKPRTRIATVGTSLGGLSRMNVMALRNTFRNPFRTALTIFVVGISIGTAGSWLVVTDSSMTFLNSQVASDTWDLRADFSHMVPDSNISEVVDLPDAEYVIPFAFLAGKVEKGSSIGAYIVACDEMGRARDFDVSEGELDFSGAVITNKLAKELDLSIGSTISISVGSKAVSHRVEGIVYDILSVTVYLDRTAASPLVDPEMSSGTFIKLLDKGKAGSIASDLKADPTISRVTVQDDISDTVSEFFGQAMSMLWSYFVFTLMIALVIAGSAIIISMMERDLEFATLETLGIKRSKVVVSLLVEIAIIGTASAALGVPLAYIIGKIVALVMQEVLYAFPILFAVSTVLLTFMMGFLSVMGSSIFPIRYTAKLDVERTMRERAAG